MPYKLDNFDFYTLCSIIKYLNPIDQVSLANTNKLLNQVVKQFWCNKWKKVNLNEIDLQHENFPFFYNHKLSINTRHIVSSTRKFNEFLKLFTPRTLPKLIRLEIRGNNSCRFFGFDDLSYRCPNVVELLFDNVAVDAYSIISLNKLRVLRLNACTMAEYISLNLIIRNVGLKQLDMRVSNPDDTNNVILSKSRCRKLETLRTLQYHLLKNLNDILELKYLKILYISCWHRDEIEPLNTDLLTGFLNNKHERIFSFSIFSLKCENDIYRNIEIMKNLQILELNSMKIKFLQRLTNLTKLRSLYLDKSYGFTAMCLFEYVCNSKSSHLTLISLYGCHKLHEDTFWPIGEFLQNSETFRLLPLNFNIQDTNVINYVLQHENYKQYENVMNLSDKRKSILRENDSNGIYVLKLQ